MNLLLFNFIVCTVFGLVISLLPLDEKVKNNTYLFFSFVMLLFFHSMVDPFSMFDLPIYYQKYYELSQMSWIECLTIHNFHMEIGYRIFMKTVSVFTSNFNIFLFTYSTLLLVLYYFVIRKYSPMVILSITIFMLTTYNQSIFVIRQHLAVALCLASIPLIVEHKLVDFILLCTIAFFLHKSAVVFFPMYFLYKMEGKKLVWTIIVGSLFLAVLSDTILTMLANEFGYMSYVDSDKHEGLNYISFLISLSFLLLYIITMKKRVFEMGINKVVFIALVLSTMLGLFGMGFAIGRLGIYFSIFSIISLPLSLNQIREVWLRVIIVVFVLALLFYPTYLGSSFTYIENYRLAWESPSYYLF